MKTKVNKGKSRLTTTVRLSRRTQIAAPVRAVGVRRSGSVFLWRACFERFAKDSDCTRICFCMFCTVDRDPVRSRVSNLSKELKIGRTRSYQEQSIVSARDSTSESQALGDGIDSHFNFYPSDALRKNRP